MTSTKSKLQKNLYLDWLPNPFFRLAGLSTAYILAVYAGLSLVTKPEGTSVVWPASGLALALLLIIPERQWPVSLGMIFAVNLFFNRAFGVSWAISSGFAFTNTLEPLVCGWVLRRWLGEKILFERVKDVFGLALAAVVLNGLTAVFGALTVYWGYGVPFRDTWLGWVILDGLSILILTPSFITLAALKPFQRLTPQRIIQSIGLVVLLLASCWFMFGMQGIDIYLEQRPYMLFPIILGIALQFSPRSSSAALVAACIISLVGTGWSDTTFHPLGGDTLREQIISVQSFFGVASFTALLVSAVVTERKETAYRLQASEKRFRALIEKSTDAITLLDGKGKITYEGPMVEAITGFNSEDRLGGSGFDTVYPEDIPLVRQLLTKVITQPGSTYALEFRAVRRSGKIWWAEGSATNLLDDPDVQAIVINYRDVTTRKLAQLERERLMVELERKNKELESLIYIASHDLRSPLVNIQGFGKNLEKYCSQLIEKAQYAQTMDDFRNAALILLQDRIPNALRFIATSSNKMDTLINGLLRLSRVGRATFHVESIEMDAFLQSILDSMAFQLGEAHALVHMEKPLVRCIGDKNQLNQAFSNLLDNAVKYRDQHRPLEIHISSRVEGEKAIYTIVDSGRGIAPENLDKIWQLFQRIDTDDKTPGEGLGLTLTRRIIERQSGRIWAESEPGIGSKFFIELPAAF